MEKGEEGKLLGDEYDLCCLGEVVGSKEEGIDSRKEGVSLNSGEMREISDDYKGGMEVC